MSGVASRRIEDGYLTVDKWYFVFITCNLYFEVAYNANCFYFNKIIIFFKYFANLVFTKSSAQFLAC